MEILGVGMPELIFILIIALLVLGPKDMEKAGRAFGRFLNNFFKSGAYKAMTQAGQKLRNLPYELARNANEELDDLKKFNDELKQQSKSLGTWEGQGVGNPKPSKTPDSREETVPDNTIVPPRSQPIEDAAKANGEKETHSDA
jgi:Sec-independent protein translocase protein TatA